MKEIHLDKIPRADALNIAKHVFGLSDVQAENFVSLARGEKVTDVVTSKAYGAVGNLQTGSGNSRTGSLGKTKMGSGSKKTGSLGNLNTGSGSRRTGAIGNLKTGSGSARTGALPGKVDAGSGSSKTGALGLLGSGGGNKFFKTGRKIDLLLGKNKESALQARLKEIAYNPKALSGVSFKYSPSQARAPQGPGGGQWVSQGSTSADAAHAQKLHKQGRYGDALEHALHTSAEVVARGDHSGPDLKKLVSSELENMKSYGANRSHIKEVQRLHKAGKHRDALHLALHANADAIYRTHGRNADKELSKTVLDDMHSKIKQYGTKSFNGDRITFKYSASQPRVPAGGAGGGRWTSGGVGGAVRSLWNKGRPARQVYRAVGLGVTHGALSQQTGDSFFRGAGAALQGDWRKAGVQALKYGATRLGAEGLTGPAINRLDARGQKIAYGTAAATALALGLGPKNIGHAARGAARGARHTVNWWKAPRANRAWANHTDSMYRKAENASQESSRRNYSKSNTVEGHIRGRGYDQPRLSPPRNSIGGSKELRQYGSKASQTNLTRKPIIQIAMEMKNKMAAEKAGKKPAVVPPLRASFQLPVKRHKPVPAAPPPGPSTVMHVHNHFGPRPSRPMKKLAAGSTKKEISASPFVFKEGEDYRWVLLSSNGYRDRDGEIISTKALERDVALWELEGRPTQPLRWWHVSLTPDYSRGVEVGSTDFRMVHGRTLIESGKFIDPVVGEAVFKAQDGLAASVGFRHSPNEPNSDKIFNTVHIFERSLLPKGRQSNVLTQLVVH